MELPDYSHRRRLAMKRYLTRLGSVPLTFWLSMLTVGAMASPQWQSALELDRAAVGAGQWWRVLTGHLTHWNGEHLFWDTLMFLSLGLICERRDPRVTGGLLALSAGAISLGFLAGQGDLASYRGLSGIDSALFAMLLVVIANDRYRQRNWWSLAGLAVLFAGFAIKICYELASGHTLFVDSAEAGFTPLPLAHVVGAACGTAAGVYSVGLRLVAEWRGVSLSRASLSRATDTHRLSTDEV
jgi:rhomboid family GlyGly-CTERM serine protease